MIFDLEVHCNSKIKIGCCLWKGHSICESTHTNTHTHTHTHTQGRSTMDHEDKCMHACRFNMERTNELNNPPRTDFMFLKTAKILIFGNKCFAQAQYSLKMTAVKRWLILIYIVEHSSVEIFRINVRPWAVEVSQSLKRILFFVWE